MSIELMALRQLDGNMNQVWPLLGEAHLNQLPAVLVAGNEQVGRSQLLGLWP